MHILIAGDKNQLQKLAEIEEFIGRIIGYSMESKENVNHGKFNDAGTEEGKDKDSLSLVKVPLYLSVLFSFLFV